MSGIQLKFILTKDQLGKLLKSTAATSADNTPVDRVSIEKPAQWSHTSPEPLLSLPQEIVASTEGEKEQTRDQIDRQLNDIAQALLIEKQLQADMDADREGKKLSSQWIREKKTLEEVWFTSICCHF